MFFSPAVISIRCRVNVLLRASGLSWKEWCYIFTVVVFKPVTRHNVPQCACASFAFIPTRWIFNRIQLLFCSSYPVVVLTPSGTLDAMFWRAVSPPVLPVCTQEHGLQLIGSWGQLSARRHGRKTPQDTVHCLPAVNHSCTRLLAK